MTMGQTVTNASTLPDGIGKLLTAGVVAIVLLVGGLGGWAATTSLAGAVLAHGTVIVDSNVKKVQHPSGGIVGKIHVKDGDRVAAGDLLIELDETVTRANASVLAGQLDELVVRIARLRAERDGQATFALRPQDFPHRIGGSANRDRTTEADNAIGSSESGTPLERRVAQLRQQLRGIEAQLSAKSPPDADKRDIPAVTGRGISVLIDPELFASEMRLFESRLAARQGQHSQLRERIVQLNEQLVGVAAQLKAKELELDLVKTEVAAQKDLWEKNLMSIAKYTASQREAARLEGERGQLIAANAQIKARVSETKLQILQIDQDLKSEVTKDLREAQAKVAELTERLVAARDQLKRVDIRAPQSGLVHQLSVHTVGGVISQGEALMLIVPEDDRLVIEAKISPQDIDHVRTGQSAFIRFSAFNQRTTPEYQATVERVSADLTREPQTQQAFYVARLALDAQALKSDAQLKLVPGMPAEVQIQTGERTALSYLVKPLEDQIARTFKGQ